MATVNAHCDPHCIVPLLMAGIISGMSFFIFALYGYLFVLLYEQTAMPRLNIPRTCFHLDRNKLTHKKGLLQLPSSHHERAVV